MLLIERGGLEPSAVREALRQTFERRAGHPLPEDLPPPPGAWEEEFPAMAAETGIAPGTVAEAFAALVAYWYGLGIGRAT